MSAAEEVKQQPRMCRVCRFWFDPESNEQFCSMLCLRWYKERVDGVQ